VPLRIPLDGSHNFRSVADWRARDGRRVTHGKLFRADGLDQLSDADQARLAGLGLSHVFDLRSLSEIERAPSRWPSGMAPRIWTGAESAAEADIMQLMQRDAATGRDFHAAMCQVYARFPNDLAKAFASVAATLLDDPDCDATLIHCAAGKDRTGFTVAMLLHAIGIERDDVMADYLLSNASFDVARERFDIDGRLSSLEARAPGAVAALVGVDADYLHAAEKRMEQDFGSIDNWLEQSAGLSAGRRDLLAARLLG
jgi:protein-tyrosine phosphatase